VSLDARERLIVALDVPSVAAGEAMVARLGDAVWFYKIGYQLAFAGGLPFAARLIASGKQVFLDLKLHDIPETVARATARAADLGVALVDAYVRWSGDLELPRLVDFYKCYRACVRGKVLGFRLDDPTLPPAERATFTSTEPCAGV